MHKFRKILILVLAAFIFPQTAFGAKTGAAARSVNEFPVELESEFSILVDANTGHIMHGVNIHQPAYPASMTKVMTALLLLESGHDLMTPIIHSHEAISSVMPWHSGLAYVDEFLTAEEALYAIMLSSANDTSNAVAEFLGGSMENFAHMMTARARELGAFNTNFTNAHGLWEEGHFTTAYDMALIMREALTHQLFRDIISTQSFEITMSINREENDPLFNTHNMIFPASMYYNPDIVGGKTGFTNNSRHTLVSYGRRGDIGLISVVMAADHRGGIFTDTAILMDYGFGQFLPRTAFSSGDFTQAVNLVQRSGEGVLIIGDVEIYAESDVMLSLPIGFDTDSIHVEIHLPDRIVAPVAGDFAVGRVSIEHEGNILAEVALLTAHAGYQLSPDNLAELFPGGGIALDYAYYAEGDDSIPTANLILNIALAIIGVLVFGFVMLRFLQFSRSSRRRKSMGKYRGYRGYSGPYRATARDYKFRYRYK